MVQSERVKCHESLTLGKYSACVSATADAATGALKRKWTTHREPGAYRRGREVGATCWHGARDARQANTGCPQLTAGEISQGGIKKPQSLGWAVAAVNACRQSRLDAPLAYCTVSYQEGSVKLGLRRYRTLATRARHAASGRTIIDTSPRTPYTGVAHP